MSKEHDQYTSEYPTTEVDVQNARNRTRMRLTSTNFKCLLSHSKSNRSRLNNEIQLYFNILSMYEYETSRTIGIATKADSESMKTIANLTMIFLPPTFVCALFSTTFFNYETGQWGISNNFWVYWAVAIPVTGLTFAAWVLWNRASAQRWSTSLPVAQSS
jgi:Mg2+ and Co2+ transporter CorA